MKDENLITAEYEISGMLTEVHALQPHKLSKTSDDSKSADRRKNRQESFRNYRMKEIIDSKDMEPGIVVGFNLKTGYGFIGTNNGDESLYFHVEGQRHAGLARGRIVATSEHPSERPENEPYMKNIRVGSEQREKVVYVDPDLKIGCDVWFLRRPIKAKKPGQEEVIQDTAVIWFTNVAYERTRDELLSKPLVRLLKTWVEPAIPDGRGIVISPPEDMEEEVFQACDEGDIALFIRQHEFKKTEPSSRSPGEFVDIQWQWQLKSKGGEWMSCGNPMEEELVPA